MEIKALRRDMTAINDGIWISSDRVKDLGDIRVKVRGLSSLAASAAIEEAIRGGKDRSKAIAEAVPAVCLIDIEGLTDGGEPVAVEAVKANLLDPAWDPLAHIILQAVVAVDRLREADTEAVAKN